MHPSGFLTAGAHRLRHWLPALTLLWALAATVAMLQPCRDAFAAALPHPHGVQVASDAHTHRHAEAAACHTGPAASCRCAELTPAFTATVSDSSVLPVTPEGSGLISATVPPAGDLPVLPSASRRGPAAGPPTYLTTGRLRI